jgi:hypothetical protein
MAVTPRTPSVSVRRSIRALGDGSAELLAADRASSARCFDDDGSGSATFVSASSCSTNWPRSMVSCSCVTFAGRHPSVGEAALPLLLPLLLL